MDSFDFFDTERFSVKLEIKAHDRTRILDATYPEDVSWKDIVDDLVSVVEAAYGYSFNINEEIGIYYPGKQDDSE